jgi:hypothetical protein
LKEISVATYLTSVLKEVRYRKLRVLRFVPQRVRDFTAHHGRTRPGTEISVVRLGDVNFHDVFLILIQVTSDFM